MLLKRSVLYLSFTVLFLSLLACGGAQNESETSDDYQAELVSNEDSDFHDHEHFDEESAEIVDLSGIKKRGQIRVVVDNSSTSYFIYRGRRMGFEYELLHRMAEDFGLDLKIRVSDDMAGAFDLLETGRADLLAFHLTVTLDRKERVDFSIPHTRIRQVLVQRKPQNWRKMKLHEIEQTMIRDVLDLGGKTIHVRKGSAFAERLRNLSSEIGEEIDIVEVEAVSSEYLMEQVLNGEISYTVADEDLAKINVSYHPDLDVETAISFPQQIAWAIRKGSPELKTAVDEWLTELKRSADFQTIYDRYYKYAKSQRKRSQSEFSSSKGKNISPYDDIIKAESKRIGWDWRLLASQIYQESRFDPKTVSWAGAEGLMQLTKATQEENGLKNPFKPEPNIKAGVSHLLWLEDYWKDKILDEEERMKFILASYNTGHAHVADAMRLAEKYGANPSIWYGNVEKYLLLKSNPEYHQDPVVRYGYCKGIEPTKYVKEILERFEEYKNFFDPDEVSATSITSL